MKSPREEMFDETKFYFTSFEIIYNIEVLVVLEHLFMGEYKMSLYNDFFIFQL